MAEKRQFPRKKKRLIVDFEIDGIKHTAFTLDLSHTGLLVSSTRIPEVDQKIPVRLHRPDGKTIEFTGRVVQARKLFGRLTYAKSRGFGVELTGYVEEYADFVSSL